MSLSRQVASALLRTSTVNAAVRAVARLRGHRLVLVYHGLSASPRAQGEIVPSIPVKVFKSHLQALAEVLDLVTLDQIVEQNGGSALRPAVAVTFDDDLPSHVEHALPALKDAGVAAAFFLSGRTLHGSGPYWFQHLEALVNAFGPPRTARMLGTTAADAGSLVEACERNADVRRLAGELARELPTPEVLDRAGIRALGDAGMTVGFHTVDHDLLPSLDDVALEDAVARGRADLAAIAGSPISYFAYPHGKADGRSAAAVRRAGFKAAFTGAARPIRRGDDPHCFGRWEPGPLSVDDLLVKLAVRLHRAAPLVTLRE